MNLTKNTLLRVGLGVFAAAAFSLSGCADSNSPNTSMQRVQVNENAIANANHVWDNQPSHIKSAIAIQNRHTSDLLDIDGVIGTGVGEDDSHANTAVIMVFTSKDGVHGVPASIEGVKTKIEHVGEVSADPLGKGSHGGGTGGSTGGTTFDPKVYSRPLKGGMSTINSNDLCASGTIGCFLHVANDSHTYMLSNNHVFARENHGVVSTDPIIQPGRYDQNCNVTGYIGKLSSFRSISTTDTNEFDAAIAVVDDSLASAVTGEMYNGAMPTSTVAGPYVGLAITKVGRTSGVTTGTIGAVNVVIRVSYTDGTAIFKNQIYVKGQFIKAGDSGSLMMTSSGYNPVGLCFAGSNSASFASPIGPVLSYFGATVYHN